MTDIIVVVILIAVVGSAIRYIIKAKKSGAKCIGCHVEGGCCSGKQSEASACTCGCGGTVAEPSDETTPCCCCGKDEE